MKKSIILQLTLCVALCFFFSCKQETTTDANTTTSTSSTPEVKPDPVRKIQKTVLSPEQLAQLTRFQDKATGKFGYKNEKGEVVTKPIYDAAMSYRESNFARVMKDGKFGFIGVDGSVKIPLKYKDAGIFSEELAAVKEDKKWGYINKSGAMVIPAAYDFTMKFNEGVSSVQKDGKWGYIDKTGKEVIPIKYSATGYFNNGLASVQMDGKWGYVDRQNKVIIPFEYESADPFGMSEANAGRVKKGKDYFYINTNGDCVKDCPK